MPQSVWGNMFGNAGHASVFLNDTLNGTRSEATIITGSINGLKIFAIIEKKGNERIGASVEIIADAVGGGFGDENRAIFVTFAADDKFTAFEID